MAAKTEAYTQDNMVGQVAPDFTLDGTNGTVHLSELRGQVVVLYFYPRDNTPGCTTEACDFRDMIHEFTQVNAIVLGVSTDSLTSHEKFTAKYQLPFNLLSDPNAEVANLYGVYKQKNMYGKISYGIERSTFIIDQDGIIRYVFRKVKVPGHVEQVKELVNSLTRE
ncbi:peroxiredoxin Q/BCP [Sulfobacillus thermosulfidooxidans DSM 9293]|uniref:thioredoxin-dependent peroxiredoxin n=2 Tax=Sulfobacillus thermosulfidooxidans TaxID=28034 RepID=A0A1W1WDZ1_SULTA|nr:peroxiredoxin Q/BCP [Sulfobacillus thermosulfidooxidans DSM 9293]